jgi:hypothetical protein
VLAFFVGGAFDQADDQAKTPGLFGPGGATGMIVS